MQKCGQPLWAAQWLQILQEATVEPKALDQGCLGGISTRC